MAYYFKEAKKEFKDLTSQMMSNPSPKLMQQLANAMSVQHVTTQPPQMQLIPATQLPSSTDCTTTVPSFAVSTKNKVRYLVDNISKPMVCTLFIRYGINNHRTKKVATSLAILGHKFHGNDIPEDYCRVEVMTVVQGSENGMLDIPRPKGIETLGQAIKNFIFCLDGLSNWSIHHRHRLMPNSYCKSLHRQILLYKNHHLLKLDLLLLILYSTHCLCHKYHHLGLHHLLLHILLATHCLHH
jgi:hypothetical protein